MTAHFLIVGLWLAGLVCALMPVPSLETQFFTGSVLCVGAASFLALWQVYKNGAFIPKSPLMIVGLLFWALAFVSVLFSEVKLESYLYFWFFSALPLSFLIFTFVNDQKLFAWAGYGVGGVIALLALMNLGFYICAPEYLYRGQAGWPFADPNALAGVLSLGFFASLGVMLCAPKKLQSGAALILAILCVGVMFITGSRAALVALGIAFGVFAIFQKESLLRHKKCLGILGVSAVLVFLVLEFVGASGAMMPSAMVTNIVSQDNEVRGTLWRSAWEIIRTHFWIGTGIGTFYLYYPEVRGGDYVTAGVHAHNDVLEFCSDLGVLAPVLFYTFITLALVRTMKAFKRADDVSKLKILAPFCALAAMVAHTHVEFNFYVLPTLMMAGLFLAYWMCVTEQVLQETPVRTAWPEAGVGFAALIMCFGLVVFGGAVGSQIFVRKAQEASAHSDMEAFSVYVNKAGRWSQNRNAQAFVLAAQVPMGLIESQRSDVDVPALKAQAEGLLSKAHDLNPRSASILVQQARLARITGDFNRSAAILEQALVLNPLYLTARTDLAFDYRALGKPREAYETLKAGLRWPYLDEETDMYFDDVIATAPVFGDAEGKSLAIFQQQKHHGLLGARAARKIAGSD